MSDNDWILKPLTDLGGVQRAVVATSDGLVWASSEPHETAEPIAALSAALHGAAAAISAECAGGDKTVAQQLIDFPGGFVFIQTAEGGGRLVVVTTNEANPQMVASEMQALIRRMGPVLSVPVRQRLDDVGAALAET